MAYVLGFFAADGNMVNGLRGNRYISFHSTDKSLLFAIRKVIDSEHKIAVHKRPKSVRSENWKTAYQIQIGSKEMFGDLLKRGMKPNKTATLTFPKVPTKYLPDFVRGYFDGDGYVHYGIYKRRDRKAGSFQKILFSGFVTGSKHFFPMLHQYLKKEADIRGGSLHFSNRAWRLSFSNFDSLRLYEYMYNDSANSLFLDRKKIVFERFKADYQMGS